MEPEKELSVEVAYEPDGTKEPEGTSRQTIITKDGGKVTIVHQYGKNNIHVNHIDTLNL